MILQSFFDVSIPVCNMEIERRPYHRNCTCALHNLKNKNMNACSGCNNVKFLRNFPCNKSSVSLEASRTFLYHFKKERTKLIPFEKAINPNEIRFAS